MNQPQPINLVPNLQAQAMPKVRKGGGRAARTGKFEDIINLGGSSFRHQQKDFAVKMPEVLKGQTQEVPDIADMPLKPWYKPQPEEEPARLYILTPVPPLIEVDLDFISADQTPKPLQILETIVSVLEGNNSNILINKEIVHLLAEFQQVLQIEEQALPQELATALKEVMARMPQTEDIAEMPRKLAHLTNFIAKMRGYLCPPENANDDQTMTVAQEAEFMPTAPVAASSQTAYGEDEAFNEGQPKTEESVQDLPHGASFTIAPARIAFAERLSLTAAQTAQPLTTENIFSAMVERIVSLPEASPHMEISLKPDHLGKLVIDLRLGDNGLSAKILVGDEGVRNLLSAQINRLSETLAERGIRLENVDVVYTALSDTAFGERQHGDEEAHKSAKGGKAHIAPAEPLTALLWENVYDLSLMGDDTDWGISSVEYRA